MASIQSPAAEKSIAVAILEFGRLLHHEDQRHAADRNPVHLRRLRVAI
jgi:hypothetical protein